MVLHYLCGFAWKFAPYTGATFEAISRKRASLVEEGKGVPDLMNQTLERLFNYDNPWVSSKRERGAWAKGLDIPVLKADGKESPVCYFAGCTTSFDTRAQEIAKAFCGILKHTGVSSGSWRTRNPLGDIARVTGELGLFQEKMENCLELFHKYSIKDVVTSSPHCFHTFLNEYSQTPFRVRHYSSVLKELMAEGRLKTEKSGERHRYLSRSLLPWPAQPQLRGPKGNHWLNPGYQTG